MGLILQGEYGRNEVTNNGFIAMRRQGKRDPLSLTTEGLIDWIDWILVDNDTHTIIRGMFLKGFLQGGGCERSTDKVNIDRGKRGYR